LGGRGPPPKNPISLRRTSDVFLTRRPAIGPGAKIFPYRP